MGKDSRKYYSLEQLHHRCFDSYCKHIYSYVEQWHMLAIYHQYFTWKLCRYWFIACLKGLSYFVLIMSMLYECTSLIGYLMYCTGRWKYRRRLAALNFSPQQCLHCRKRSKVLCIRVVTRGLYPDLL